AWSLRNSPADLLAETIALIAPTAICCGAVACAAALVVGLAQSRGLFRPALIFEPRTKERSLWPGKWALVFGALACLAARAYLAIVGVVIAVAFADAAFAYLAHLRRNRMTRREVEAEAREGEVSPE